MDQEKPTAYYLERKENYWRKLGRLIGASNHVLPAHLDPEQVAAVPGQTRAEFERLLAELPDIGGDDNIYTFTLVSAAAALAYIRVLAGYGLPLDTIGQILNDVYAHLYGSLPRVVKWVLRRATFSRREQRRLKAFARRSQQRHYPGDWVAEYVEGDGQSFDFGCNYTECAVLKFFRQMGAEVYMPYVCVMDFTMSSALHTGLRRTTTLHFGGDCCDFRYRQGELALPALPIENLPEYQALHRAPPAMGAK